MRDEKPTSKFLPGDLVTARVPLRCGRSVSRDDMGIVLAVHEHVVEHSPQMYPAYGSTELQRAHARGRHWAQASKHVVVRHVPEAHTYFTYDVTFSTQGGLSNVVLDIHEAMLGLCNRCE